MCVRVSIDPSFNSKFHFNEYVLINLILLRYRIYPKYSHPYFLPYIKSTLVISNSKGFTETLHDIRISTYQS